jgi:hypothetical protein
MALKSDIMGGKKIVYSNFPTDLIGTFLNAILANHVETGSVLKPEIWYEKVMTKLDSEVDFIPWMKLNYKRWVQLNGSTFAEDSWYDKLCIIRAIKRNGRITQINGEMGMEILKELNVLLKAKKSMLDSILEYLEFTAIVEGFHGDDVEITSQGFTYKRKNVPD